MILTNGYGTTTMAACKTSFSGTDQTFTHIPKISYDYFDWSNKYHDNRDYMTISDGEG